jgi:hypothetical protein
MDTLPEDMYYIHTYWAFTVWPWGAQDTDLFPHFWVLSSWKVALTSRRLRLKFCLS